MMINAPIQLFGSNGGSRRAFGGGDGAGVGSGGRGNGDGERRGGVTGAA
jgi:hypothetical protein